MGTGFEHLSILLDKIQREHPYWNRTGGRDHFLWLTRDGGMCNMPEGLVWYAIKVGRVGHRGWKTQRGACLGSTRWCTRGRGVLRPA